MLVSAFVSKADIEYLYWKVYQCDLPSEKQVDFKYAQLAVYKDGTRLTDASTGEDVYMDVVVPGEKWNPGASAYPYGTLLGAEKDASGLAGIEQRCAVILSDWQDAAYSFQLELYNEDWSQAGPDQIIVSYEELKHAIFEESGSAGAGHTWNAVGPAPVPEPTGGTLALLGLALLGLKRKRFKTVDAMT